MKTNDTHWALGSSAPRPYIPATQYFDLTPTWSGLMPALIAAAGNGSKGAIDELMKLAATVDRLNAKNKQAK